MTDKIKGTWEVKMVGVELGEEEEPVKRVDVEFQHEEDIYIPYAVRTLAESIAEKLELTCDVHLTFRANYKVKGGESE